MKTSRSSELLPRSLTLAMAVLLALGAGACGRKNGGDGGRTGGDAGSPVPGDQFYIHFLSDPENLNPLTSTDAGATEINNMMYETLTQLDWETLVRVPILADSLPRVSDDHLSYEFSIRKDAKFADGHPVTAADFIFFLKALKNPLVVNAAPTRGYYVRVDRAEMIDNDPYRLRVVMNQPYYLGDRIAADLAAMPKHIWDPKGLTDKISFDDLNQARETPEIKEFADWFQDPEKARSKAFLLGSGPYVFESWTRNDKVILVRNEKYWNKKDPKYGRQYPDRIIYKTINDMNAAVASLKRGDVDFMPIIEPLQYRNMRNNLTSFHLDSAVYETPAYTYIGYNEDRPVFKDRLVRQALAHAIDRPSIIKSIYFGYARPVQSPLLPSRPESDTTIPVIPYDLNKAKALLAQAGWSDTDGDGVLDKVINGRKTPFKFQILLNSGNERRKSMGLIFVQALKQIGVDASTQSIDWALFLDRTRDGDYDAFIGGWVSSVDEGDMYQIWHSASAERGGSNYVRFRNARVDELIEKIRGEFDYEKRKGYYREVQQILNEEQPYNFLVAQTQTGAYNNRFEGVAFFEPRPNYVPAWWWVPAQAQKYKSQAAATAMR
jgi:peptide/nickel transport system substrate-binding protein